MTDSRGTTIIAVVPDDADRTDPAVARATELVRDTPGRVILYDIGAAPSPFESPMPTEFSSEGEDRDIPPVLTSDDLDAAGHASLAGLVRAFTEAGIESYGWLPETDDADELATYARAQGAAVVIARSDRDPKPEDLREAGVPGVEAAAAGRTGR